MLSCAAELRSLLRAERSPRAQQDGGSERAAAAPETHIRDVLVPQHLPTKRAACPVPPLPAVSPPHISGCHVPTCAEPLQGEEITALGDRGRQSAHPAPGAGRELRCTSPQHGSLHCKGGAVFSPILQQGKPRHGAGCVSKEPVNYASGPYGHVSHAHPCPAPSCTLTCGKGSWGGSFWGKEGCRGALPEGCALPWSWRAARASRRCARCCAGCSAAPGTPGWPSRCSGPFGTKQKQDSA